MSDDNVRYVESLYIPMTIGVYVRCGTLCTVSDLDLCVLFYGLQGFPFASSFSGRNNSALKALLLAVHKAVAHQTALSRRTLRISYRAGKCTARLQPSA